MELKHDLVRDILLYIEENFGCNDLRLASSIKIEGFSTPEVLYTCRRLLEAGYIVGKTMSYDSVPDTSISGLTWNGHEYLDNIRDNGIWKKTKDIAAKVGSVSLSAMGEIASQVVASVIAQTIGGQ